MELDKTGRDSRVIGAERLFAPLLVLVSSPTLCSLPDACIIPQATTAGFDEMTADSSCLRCG